MMILWLPQDHNSSIQKARSSTTWYHAAFAEAGCVVLILSTGKTMNIGEVGLEERLLQLADCFAVDLYGFAIMSNHFHLLVRYDPNAASQWSDQEVADRWIRATNVVEDLQPDYRDNFLGDADRVRRARETLGSLSLFMKHLKQPIAWRANREDGCTGHFFEGRFYSGLLLTEEDVIEAMAYVDLNPVRAKIVKHAVEANHTSAALRLRDLESNKKRLEDYLGPIVAGTRSLEEKKKDKQPTALEHHDPGATSTIWHSTQRILQR